MNIKVLSYSFPPETFGPLKTAFENTEIDCIKDEYYNLSGEQLTEIIVSAIIETACDPLKDAIKSV